MAKMTVTGLEDFSSMIRALGDKGTDVAKAAVYAGAGVLAEAVKAEISALPVEEGFLPPGDLHNVITASDKEDLLRGVGISHMEDAGGKVTAAVGVNGYSSTATKKYPSGVPLPLIARSIESGSSVRRKNPFMRRAGNAAKARAQQAMTEAAMAKINELTGG